MKKIILLILTAIAITLMMPRRGVMNVSLVSGEVWADESIIAPFDIPIQKSMVGLDAERKATYTRFKPIFRKDTIVGHRNIANASHIISNLNSVTGARDSQILEVLSYIYDKGVVSNTEYDVYQQRIIRVTDNNNRLEDTPMAEIFTPVIAARYIQSKGLKAEPLMPYIASNLRYDENLNKEISASEIASISNTKGMIRSGDVVVARGQVVDNNTIQVFDSFRREYEKRIGSREGMWLVMAGRFLIVMSILLFNFMFFAYFPKQYIGTGIRSMLFVFLLYAMVAAGVAIASDSSILSAYVVPIPIVAIYMITFFNVRVAVLANISIAMITSLFVRLPFEFIMVSIITGMVAIFMMRHYYRRSNLFLAIGIMLLAQIFVYVCMSMLRHGDFVSINYGVIVWFVVSAVLALGLCQLVYPIEKIFGFVSDMTLLDLCDTNQPLLQELSQKAPGTFQHSIQVANLAESAAKEIGANPLLARAGALYHDIGKLSNAYYFVENTSTGFNPHQNIEPKESAGIVKQHITDGVALAKKANLPQDIIDFICQHHGTSCIYYFYSAHENKYGDVDDRGDFYYDGPKPIGKEVSICMMADAVEAASRSLKTYDEKSIEELVDKIIRIQIEEGQMDESKLSLSEIKTVSRVFCSKLNNIYHVRISYPERKK